MKAEPTTAEIAEAVVALVSNTSPPSSLGHLIEVALRAAGIRAGDAAELKERQEVLVRRKITSIRAIAIQHGEVPPIAFNTIDGSQVQGVGFIEPGASEEEQRERRLHQHLPSLRAAIDRLEAGEFELLAAALLRRLGVSDAARTPHSRDDGIDVVGTLPLFPELGVAAGNLAVLGQVKHRPRGSVTPDEARALVGAIVLFERRGGPGSTVGVFITSGTFSPGAWRVARMTGMLTLTGDLFARTWLLQEPSLACAPSRIRELLR